MITRRKLLSSTGVLAAGAALAGQVGASVVFSSPTHKSRQVLVATDELASGLGFGKAKALASLRSQVIPNDVFSNLSTTAEWLQSTKGQCVVCVVDAKQSFMLEAALVEARARVLYQGKHHAMAFDSGSVRHDITELPVSAGLAKSLPNNGAWSSQLVASLSQVANRSWSSQRAVPALPAAQKIHPASASLSLATYVIEI